MKRKYGLVLVILLVMVLLLAGCGRAGGGGTNTAAGDRDNGAKSGAGNTGTGDSARTKETVAVDFSNPEEVVLAFWAAFTAGNFDLAANYLSNYAQGDLLEFRADYEANPYAMKVWKLVSGYS
jgi:hypothetical protein